MKKETPFVHFEEHKTEEKQIIDKLQKIMEENRCKPNTETNRIYLQTEIDNLFSGKRLFEVQKAYDIYKEKAKLYGYDEYVWVEKKVLNPHVLNIVFVGEYEDLLEYGLIEYDEYLKLRNNKWCKDEEKLS